MAFGSLALVCPGNGLHHLGPCQSNHALNSKYWYFRGDALVLAPERQRAKL